MNQFVRSLQYAWQGFCLALREQRNCRIHCAAALLAMAASLFLQISLVEWCIILICIGAVISAELFNSAVEKWVDLVSPDWNKKAGEMKDMSAAAVLMLAITAAIIGGLIFGKHLFFGPSALFTFLPVDSTAIVYNFR